MKRNSSTIKKVKTALLSMQRLSWEHGVAIRAFIEQNDIDLAILLATEAIHRQHPDGRMALCADTYISCDPGANGIPVLLVYTQTGDKKMLKAVKKMESYYMNIAPRTSCGVLTHFSGEGDEKMRKMVTVVMIDSIYHVCPFLAACKQYDEAMNQLRGFKRLLYDNEKKLYHHQWDDTTKDFARKDYWGGGTGWAICACVWMFELLPANMVAQKKELAEHALEIIDSMLKWETEDGMFHDVVDNPDSFKEVTAGLMLSYGIYESIRLNILDASYKKRADRLLKTAFSFIDDYGILQQVCGAPNFNKLGTSPEAQAFLLLADAAEKRLTKH